MYSVLCPTARIILNRSCMDQEKKFWESSVEQGKIALRLRGVLVAFVPLVILIANANGIGIDEEGVLHFVDLVVNGVASIFALIGVGMSVWGYLRRKV